MISHRPNDYHPDHRYTGVLVQDSAYMVAVPFFCPDTPPLKRNPVFLYYSDGFQKPNPFTADIAVAIDDVIDKKLDAVDALVSQVYEGGAMEAKKRPKPPRRRSGRSPGLALRETKEARPGRRPLPRDVRQVVRPPQKAKTIKYAEAFEICEHGQPCDRDADLGSCSPSSPNLERFLASERPAKLFDDVFGRAITPSRRRMSPSSKMGARWLMLWATWGCRSIANEEVTHFLCVGVPQRDTAGGIRHDLVAGGTHEGISLGDRGPDVTGGTPCEQEIQDDEHDKIDLHTELRHSSSWHPALRRPNRPPGRFASIPRIRATSPTIRAVPSC